MTTPVPSLPVFSTRRAGLRQAIVDAAVVGRAVYTPSGLDQARAPYVVLTDAQDIAPQLTGDGGVIAESCTGEASLYQANSRDADPYLAGRITKALNGLRFVVEHGGDRWLISVRATSPTVTDTEGFDERTVTWTAYQETMAP